MGWKPLYTYMEDGVTSLGYTLKEEEELWWV